MPYPTTSSRRKTLTPDQYRVTLGKVTDSDVYGAWITLAEILLHDRVEVNKMDTRRKRELLESYKSRRPEMGVISYHCKETGDVFLDTSRDTKASFNSTNFKLSGGSHPNKQLQMLWNQYGSEAFELSIVKVLKYKDPHEDHTAKLEELINQCLAENPQARRVWR